MTNEKNYTTIQISEETKQGLLKIKDIKHLKYDVIIQQLIELHGGTLISDVVRINRESVALSLKYWEEQSNRVNVYDITFHELRTASVGAEFTANNFPAETGYVNTNAKLVYKADDDVILLVETVDVGSNGETKVDSEVIHVKLF